VVPGDTAPADAREAVGGSGMKLAVLLDEADALYARLGIRMHPGIAIVDRTKTLVAYEPFQQIDYCGTVLARLRRALGELSDADVAKALAPADSALPGADSSGVAKRHLTFGRKLLAAKAYALAHENARKAASLAPSAAAWTLEGDIFAAEGKCGEAAKAFDAALSLAPGDPAATAGKQGCRR
jgi:tetratricopeptide (TPR) repeat protein